MSGDGRTTALVWALVLPLPIHLAISALMFAVGHFLRSPWLLSLGAVASLVASVSVGYVFVARAFHSRRMMAGILYYPLMLWMVLYRTMYLVGRLFGMTL
jgi:hypothetical protein